ncbi:MAG: hypothetical protein IJI73_02820 [Kiritimatiellae bacterium]|nr:hypothetical protein [Kiritimatiellia bacterium]
MCELMTIAAAVAFTVLFAVQRRAGRPAGAAFTTMLMFWGAALMWSVDCIANRLDGEPLLDISREDTILGFIILAAGAVVYAALAVAGRIRAHA